MERTAKPIKQEFETYRFSNPKFAATSFEGRVMLDFDTKPVDLARLLGKISACLSRKSPAVAAGEPVER